MTAQIIDSSYASIDVKKGRHKLLRELGTNPSAKRIPITLKGWLIYAASNDDGTSIEFAVDVESVVALRDD